MSEGWSGPKGLAWKQEGMRGIIRAGAAIGLHKRVARRAEKVREAEDDGFRHGPAVWQRSEKDHAAELITGAKGRPRTPGVEAVG